MPDSASPDRACPQPAAPAACSQTLAHAPVLILGGRPRSGTNLFFDLLALHPGLCPTRLPEDGLLRPARHLAAYVREAAGFWKQAGWDVPDSEGAALLQALGRGLAEWLARDASRSASRSASPDAADAVAAGRRVLSKTPSVRGLAQVFRLWPAARVLLLVRDGRAVVASGMRSFGWTHEHGTRKWAESAAVMRAFMDGPNGALGRWKLVRYEDLVGDLQGVLSDVFEFLDLPAEDFDFEAAGALPVRGSSLLPDDSGKPSWKPQAKPEGFDEQPRWADWDAAQHARFNWIAGEHLDAFGYEPEVVPAERWAQRARDAAFAARREWHKLSRTAHPKQERDT